MANRKHINTGICTNPHILFDIVDWKKYQLKIGVFFHCVFPWNIKYSLEKIDDIINTHNLKMNIDVWSCGRWASLWPSWFYGLKYPRDRDCG